MLSSLTRWVLAHKRLVVIFWVLITLVGIGSASSATKALKQKFSVPGKEGWVTNQQIAREFGGTKHLLSGSRRVPPIAGQNRLSADAGADMSRRCIA